MYVDPPCKKSHKYPKILTRFLTLIARVEVVDTTFFGMLQTFANSLNFNLKMKCIHILVLILFKVRIAYKATNINKRKNREEYKKENNIIAQQQCCMQKNNSRVTLKEEKCIM